MIWTLAACFSLSLSALMVCLILIALYQPVRTTEYTLRQCEAALCILRLLMDSQEEMYLRTTLSPPHFRSVHRKRLRLAMRCLTLLDRNATWLAMTAQQAAQSDDSDLAQRGERLANGYFQLKLNLFVAGITIILKWLFPASTLFLQSARFHCGRVYLHWQDAEESKI